MRNLGLVLVGLFVGVQAHAFSFEKGNYKGEIFVGNFVASPLLKIVNKRTNEEVLKLSCSWNLEVNRDEETAELACSKQIQTVSGDDDEGIEITFVFGAPDFSNVDVSYEYSGDGTFLGKEEKISQAIEGQYSTGRLARNSIVHVFRGVADVLRQYLGVEAKSKQLSLEVGVNVLRPVNEVRLSNYGGNELNVSMELDYVSNEYYGDVFLEGVLDVTGKNKIDKAALKRGIDRTLRAYNESPNVEE